MSYPYLSKPTVKAAMREAKARNVAAVARGRMGFASAFMQLTPAELRIYGPEAYPNQTWAQRREGFIARHMAQVEGNGEALWDARGEPTRRHLALAVWAYSPDAAALSRWLRAQG